MKLTTLETRYIAKLRKRLDSHLKTRWYSAVACVFGAAVIVCGWLFLRSLFAELMSDSNADSTDYLIVLLSITVLYPKLLIYSLGVGGFMGYIIAHWQPDPAQSLLVKIVDQLEEDGEQDTS